MNFCPVISSTAYRTIYYTLYYYYFRYFCTYIVSFYLISAGLTLFVGRDTMSRRPIYLFVSNKRTHRFLKFFFFFFLERLYCIKLKTPLADIHGCIIV